MFLSMDPRPGLSILDIDNEAGARLATEHLLDRGYQHIGILAGPQQWWHARQRVAGWRKTLLARGKPVDESQLIEGNWSIESGEQGFIQLLERYPQMDALFVSNDQMALGVLQAMHRRGMQAPDDLAIVGFDDIPEARYYFPPLSTVRQDLKELGSKAVLRLSQMIDSRQRRNAPFPAETVLLQPTLIVRESS
jgi:DNA-binding LacI/PurR family transcriptional regulator